MLWLVAIVYSLLLKIFHHVTIPQFVRSPVDGYLGCFQSFAPMSSDVMKVQALISWVLGYVNVLLRKIILRCIQSSCIN